MLSYSTYTVILSTTHSSSIITRAVIPINGKKQKMKQPWKALEKAREGFAGSKHMQI